MPHSVSPCAKAACSRALVSNNPFRRHEEKELAVSPEYRAKAQQLATEVAASTRRRRTWRKVTTLLDYFGVYRLTPAVRRRMAEALDDAGIEVEPAMDVVQRYGTVKLSLRQPRDASDSPSDRALDSQKAITATLWRPSSSPVPVSAADLPVHEDGVLWIDVDISEEDDPDIIHEALTAFCQNGLTLEMVAGLLDVDDAPAVKVFPGEVRSVTTFQAVPSEAEGDESDPSVSKAGTVSLQPVVFLQSERWLISCWHKERPADGVRGRVEQFWRSERRTTAGDLGLAVLGELAESYIRAVRTLYAWHTSWELVFLDRRHRVETKTLYDLRVLITPLQVHLEALNRPGMSRTEHLIWFSRSTVHEDAERVDDLIDRALADLRALSDVLRTSTDLVTTMESSEQSRQAERFQELVTLVAAVLLVPTLVAGIYGANTRLPGEGHWTGFALMIVTMVVSAALTYVAIRRWRRRGAPA
jgi:Mg2+ and Co2+ transporter CorA